MTEARRAYDNGPRKYLQYLPVVIITSGIIASYAVLDFRVARAEEAIKEVRVEIKDNKEALNEANTIARLQKQALEAQIKLLEKQGQTLENMRVDYRQLLIDVQRVISRDLSR